MSSARVVADVIREKSAFILTSHARPDGDALGSQLALGLALEALGKSVTFVERDPVPTPYLAFPGVDKITVAAHADAPADTVVVLECSDLTRPGVTGLDRETIVNIDHHLGNTGFGTVNWFDPSAAACGEMVADIIDELDVTWTHDIAAHLYLAIATDTGGFRYGPMSAKTFDICRRVVLTGVSVADLSRQIFDNYAIGRVKLTGAILSAMKLYHADRVALLWVDEPMMTASGATSDDVEGLVNLPLAARGIQAVAFCRRQTDGSERVSLRAKGAIDVRAVAMRWNGGGHRSASGCALTGAVDAERLKLIAALIQAVDEAGAGEP